MKDSNTLRYVYVLTDGGVSNTIDLVNMVKNSKGMSRTIINTLGIGRGASSQLVTQLANAGGGISDMIENENVLSATVIKQLKISKNVRITNLTLEVNLLE